MSATEELAELPDVGVDPARLDVLLRRVRLEVEGGPLPSAQVALARNGRLVTFETFGEADPSTRYVLQSAGRPIVASVMWRLIGEGLLDPAWRVGNVIGEFATNGKELVTIEQVLTHTAGFPLAPLRYPAMLQRQQRLEAFSRWRLTYEPGTRLEFHLTSAGWLIAELTERVTGLSLPEYLRHEIAEPLGLTLELGVPVERQGDVAPMTLIGDAASEASVDPWGPWYLADPATLAAGEPSHAVVATARDVVLHYQALYHSGRWRPEAVDDARQIRVTLPIEGRRGDSPSVPGNVALFVLVAGDDGLSRGYLPVTGSPELFGHGGAPSQISFMDPQSGVSFAFLTNGYPASGYDLTPAGQNRITNIGNLAADVCKPA